MSTVKTAIILDELLLEQADRAAQEMGISRSHLFVMVMEAFLTQRKSRELLDAINQAYCEHPPTPQEEIYLKRMQNLYANGLGNEEW